MCTNTGGDQLKGELQGFINTPLSLFQNESPAFTNTMEVCHPNISTKFIKFRKQVISSAYEIFEIEIISIPQKFNRQLTELLQHIITS